MSQHHREHTPIRTESAGITSARQSLDNILSARTNLEQNPLWQENSVDIENKRCALELQIAELEGMLSEITDERFARTIDESQPDDESRNLGSLNIIIETADSILASLLPSSNDPPPTYQQHHHSHSPTQSSTPKPQPNSRDISFPLPQEQRNSSKRRRSLHALIKRTFQISKADPTTSSTNTDTAIVQSMPPPKLTFLVGSPPKPLSSSNPFRSDTGSLKSRDIKQDLSVDELSLSAFRALKDSDAFKMLLVRTESTHFGEIDRDNLWFSFREAFGNNLSKELLCAFDVLIRVSSFERGCGQSKVPTKTLERGSVDSARSEPLGVNKTRDKGKAPLRTTTSTTSTTSTSTLIISPPPSIRTSSSPSLDSDFVTIESPDNSQPPAEQNGAKSSSSSSGTKTLSQPPPYTPQRPTAATTTAATTITAKNEPRPRQ